MTPDDALRFFSEKKTAYQRAFGDAHGKAVLDDLMPFCRVKETCVVPGDRDRTAVLEGRREVYLRVQAYLELTPQELVERFTRPAQGAISHDRTYPDTDA